MVIVRGTRWLRAALVAPLLAFALTASSHLAIRCTITGVLMPESCCPDVGAAAPGAPDPQPALRDSGCCERVTLATEKAPAAGAEPWRLRPIDVPIAPLVAMLVPSPTAERPATQARAARPPGGSPPLYLTTHSFLI